MRIKTDYFGRKASYQPHKFEADAKMISEVEILEHVDDVVTAIFILLSDVIQNAHFNQRLMVESFLVSDQFDGYVFVGHVVQGAYHLSETALSNHLQDLVTISYVIVQDLDKISPV